MFTIQSISKLKICLCLALLFAFTASMAIAGSPEWAWDQGSYEQDGTVTMDGEDYSINPTGHQSLTGKSIRQPPTVIVQSTSSGGGGAILYAPRTKGNFGGDTYCESTFGAGYVMANVGEIMAYTHVIANVSFWENTTAYSSQNCDNWTNNSGHPNTGQAYTLTTSSGVLLLQSQIFVCDTNAFVPCIKR